MRRPPGVSAPGGVGSQTSARLSPGLLYAAEAAGIRSRDVPRYRSPDRTRDRPELA